ncbi:anaerobic ribonucleoside-triphosphate reductase activating protein [Candidatus Bathyarchaeota archaeon]|nr:anaerobic ribonucleoside-triphosphate reductase activating protein [Candidatus Bathyarchaeota archaeon]
MKFSGLQKTSLADFPDRVASVLFTPGCNLRCPFCHNWRIVVEPKPPFLKEEATLRILDERKGFVDSVVVSGGEPTIHRDLPRFLGKLKDRGFMIKLDTNGFNSQVLEECLPFVDFVALDVKTSLGKYGRLGAGDTGEFVRTVEMLKTGKVDYEFRATVVPGFVDAEDVPRIGELVRGARAFVFQQFVAGDTLDKSFGSVKPYSPECIMGFAESMQQYAENVTLRV